MAEIFGLETGMEMPDFFSGTTGTTLMILLTVFVCFLILAIGIYFIFLYRNYNKKIVVFENISGQGFQPIYKDRARLLKIGDGGEEILYLMKKKLYRTAYGRKMGKNTYWFAIGQDGYWYNIVLGDVDAKMGMLDVEPIDRDMRMMSVAVRRNITERYRKVKFMEKYGTIVMSAIFLLIMIGGIYFLLDKMTETAGTTTEGIKTAKEVMEINKQILSSLENICGGSGITPVVET